MTIKLTTYDECGGCGGRTYRDMRDCPPGNRGCVCPSIRLGAVSQSERDASHQRLLAGEYRLPEPCGRCRCHPCRCEVLS